MAGIGFELKRLFRRKGLFATMRAYGYAGIVCTGPMLLGVLLQVGILVLCGLWGVGRANQDLLVCMVTYTLLASLTLTSFFSMPVTRCLADMLFAEREDEILPSFWGSNAIMLVAGTVLYGVFLLFSGATLLQGLLCLWLFNIMIVNWNGMSYLTAIKDYRGILCSFAAAIGVACLCALAALTLGLPPVEGLLASIASCFPGMWYCCTGIFHRVIGVPGVFCAGSTNLCRLRLRGCLPTWGFSYTWLLSGRALLACRSKACFTGLLTMTFRHSLRF